MNSNSINLQSNKINPQTDIEYVIKFIIIGDVYVGKSSIMARFVDKHIPRTGSTFGNTELMLGRTYETTIGVGYGTQNIFIDDKNIKIVIWDTAGQERYKSVTCSYYRAASCAVLVYDITDRKSFHSINKWLTDVRTLADNPVIVLVGNKTDINEQRAVSFDEGQLFAKQNDMLFLETSSKSGDNIDSIFIEATRNVVKNSNNSNLNSGIKIVQRQKHVEGLKTNNNSNSTNDDSDCC